MNTATLLGLTPRIGTVGWVIFAVVTAALVILTPDAAGNWQNWVAFALILGAGALGVTRLPGPLPVSRVWIAVALLLAASTLPLFAETAEYVSFAPWYLRAITEVACWLTLRNRPLQAWIAAVLASGLAAVLSGGPLAMGRQLATLLAIQVLVIALRRAARAIDAWREETKLRASQESAREVAVTTRRAELAALAARAEPVLRRLVTGVPTAETRRDAGLLEASLRDTLRGRRLAVDPLASAVAAARERGVDVVLLDDLDAPWSSPSALEWAAGLVATASQPVTVRLSADGLTFVSGTSALRYRDEEVVPLSASAT